MRFYRDLLSPFLFLLCLFSGVLRTAGANPPISDLLELEANDPYASDPFLLQLSCAGLPDEPLVDQTYAQQELFRGLCARALNTPIFPDAQENDQSEKKRSNEKKRNQQGRVTRMVRTIRGSADVFPKLCTLALKRRSTGSHEQALCFNIFKVLDQEVYKTEQKSYLFSTKDKRAITLGYAHLIEQYFKKTVCGKTFQESLLCDFAQRAINGVRPTS